MGSDQACYSRDKQQYKRPNGEFGCFVNQYGRQAFADPIYGQHNHCRRDAPRQNDMSFTQHYTDEGKDDDSGNAIRQSTAIRAP